MTTDMSGRGVINIFAVNQLINQSPKLYATVLLWLLSEVFETLPEAGDLDKTVSKFDIGSYSIAYDKCKCNDLLT
jgi:DNA helicase HerA-like ATPase